jgi:hypothetical protein
MFSVTAYSLKSTKSSGTSLTSGPFCHMSAYNVHALKLTYTRRDRKLSKANYMQQQLKVPQSVHKFPTFYGS